MAPRKPGLLQKLENQIDAMRPDDRLKLQQDLDEAGVLDKFAHWQPQDGPQTEAFFSPADMLLYGGAAGGGKTDLICGLALFDHHRVGIFRQQSGEMTGIVDRMNQILSGAGMGQVAGNPKKWDGPGGKKIEFGHLEKPGAERSWQGRDHDLKAFDEAAQISPQKIIFVSGWNRSAKHGQRCRIVLASNPPIGGTGDYLLEWFGPWLDPAHPLYGTVKPGELLYANFTGEGDEIRSDWYTEPTKIEVDGRSEWVPSRTFIPAKMSDNRFINAGYRARINAMPEPMRTALMTGDFLAARQDHDFQVIPSEWIDLAFERYDKGIDAGAAMAVLGVDVAQGGPDRTVLAPLFGRRFEQTVVRRGLDTKDGADVGALVIRERRDGALIVVDCTGGWGGDTVGFLSRENGIPVEKCVFSEGSGHTAKESRMPFFNKRAELYWRFREALHPKSGAGIAIKRSATVKAQLTAHRWTARGNRILIESKEDIRARTGSSPDEADAIVMAWGWRDKAITKKAAGAAQQAQALPMADPLAGW